jgi:hypothetical protein
MKNTGRLIINILDNIPEEEALLAVSRVVADGRISKTKNGPSYCFATHFNGGLVVEADRHPNSDRFVVYLLGGEDG